MGKTKKKPELYHNSQTQNVLRNLMLRDCGLRTTHKTSTKEFEPLAETNFILKKLKELVSLLNLCACRLIMREEIVFSCLQISLKELSLD